ncbi:MAG: ribulose-phosphate 3-epimerase [Holosporaceae bacterium]|jgi:ribulose-phosphate 3-epimerase|nr:ribulose-phosphate 3-epimerase [Holosporaceae bacterium]
MSAKICPSLLSADPTKLGAELIALEKAGADAVHWDIMDGNFVDAITFGAHLVAAHRKLTPLRFDVHLMVQNPEGHLENFAAAGADVILVHAETCPHLHRTLCRIRDLGKHPGVALNPATPVDVVKHCTDILRMVLIMGVNPGSSGQTFIESSLQKISELKLMLPSSTEICVDGGVTDVTIGKCAAAGANSFVSGSYIFAGDDYSSAIEKLRASCR